MANWKGGGRKKIVKKFTLHKPLLWDRAEHTKNKADEEKTEGGGGGKREKTKKNYESSKIYLRVKGNWLETIS